MQCSRCHSSAYRERRVIKRPKVQYYLQAKSGEQNKFNPSNLNDFGINDDEIDISASRSFLSSYRWPLTVCAVAGAFCLVTLLHLFVSVLVLGVAAVPFLGLFLMGLIVSLALPFKLHKEHKLLH